MPVFCNVTFETPAEARRAARGDIVLRFCRGCGYIYNAAFIPALAKYAPGYENAQHFSARFRRYAEALAARLVDRLALRRKRIIEIGCGDGYFLRLLCQMGANTGVGFDPSHRQQDPFQIAAGEVSFRSACYSSADQDVPADLICCRHVLEHIAEPLRFLSELREAVGGRDHIHLYFEVPNALQVLRGSAIWDVLYEHCAYFHPAALTRLFTRAGFAPLSTWRTYEGQFLALLAKPASGTGRRKAANTPVSKALEVSIGTFASRFNRRASHWRKYLKGLRAESRQAVFWQAGSRGVTLLNAMDRSEELVRYVVDINPRKQGRYIPGSAQQIVAPELLRRHRPAAVVIMNPVYRTEIGENLNKLGIATNLLVA
ncbi:MAG: class I SAM-dependent methyltransferase [Planctomycetota bacterium]|jgi:SAM-dependent methyltransferase